MINDIDFINRTKLIYGVYIYAYYPSHPKATNEGYVRKHVLIAENKLGRRLNDNECVHHLDENKYNNKPENLIVFKTNADHSRFHKTGIKIEVEPNIYISPIKGRICPICKNEFYNTDSSIVYCSNECAKISQRKVSRPSKEELEKLIISIPFTEIGERYGVSDNAVRRWCKYYDLPYRKKDINKLLTN